MVATNWDDRLLRGMQGLPVHAVFGKLQRDPVGGGRPASVLPAVGWRDAARHVRLAHDLGFRFLYLWNAAYLGDAEYDPAFTALLRRQLHELVELGVDGIVVGVPWMIALIKEHAPQLEVCVSSLADVRSPREAEQFEAMGADVIILNHTLNRDFRVLDEIRRAVSCELELILNNSCVYQCPYHICHYVSPGFHSRPRSPDVLEYELFWCAGRLAVDGAEIVRSRWIRPEDLHVYEAHGFDRFKVAGRGRETEWLLRATRAYAARRYDGDLTDVISMSQHAPLRLARQRARETSGHAAHWADLADRLGPVGSLVLDNRAIPDDFLRFFELHDCNVMSCRSCRYCETVARRAVRGAAGWESAAAPRMPSPEMFGDLVLAPASPPVQGADDAEA